MEIIVSILPYILLFLSTLLSYPFIIKKKKKKKHSSPPQPKLHFLAAANSYRNKLPPGSMGWPYIGETPQLYSQDPNIFFASKQKRYGDIFKTHILGCPCVMVASPEAVRFVLVSHAHLFRPTYPNSKERLIGPSAIFFHSGDYHTQLRRLVQSSLAPEAIRKKIPDIEAIASSALESWASLGTVVNTFQEMKKFSFDVGILSIFGRLDDSYRQILKENYCILDKGYNSFPNTVPGTAYHRALMARKRLGHILGEIIREKREKRTVEKDLLGQLLNFRDANGGTLTDEQVSDNIIGVLFAAQDTTASALTWILKYLHDHQKLLDAVKEEQMAILEMNGGKRPLTWAQTRNMPITHRVILESLRMASIISFTFREALVDVEYKGYVIPNGWKVMPLFRNIHHNPDFFPDPQNFDPTRFEVPPKPNTFMPFGNGAHSCPGNELAKLELFILIHHLVTKYKWEVVGTQSGIQYGPFPVPLHGLPARFRKDLGCIEQDACP
ncbi:abscisic acid 8'-hydroxylase 4 [Punica granatum]|uniref:(+)-abscisic acid 8'-hydroxylase n=2 Tax=Punica granatum TaxID=22663 RepID=A0A6P8DKV4_PUNGR|nr:abscisic acid 8'-hydroxylase 4 [Punica granatum]